MTLFSKLVPNPLLSILLLAVTATASQSYSGVVETNDRNFVWYCQSDEATAAQKHTVKQLFYLADRDYDVEACNEVFEILGYRSYIELPNSDIVDLAPLSGLDGVNFINAPGNSIASLDGLVDLPALTKLWLPDNAFTAFPKLDRFPRLNNLILHNNPISSLENVKAHGSLRSLRMNGTAIKDYAPLAQLEVTWLELAATKHPEALATLPKLPSVSVANLSSNGLTDFSRFKAFPNVQSIVAAGNSITSLKSLEGFDPVPSNLNLVRNKLRAIDSDKVLHSLKSIDFSHNPISDFGFLAKLPNEILSLKLDGTAFADWSLISRFMPKLYQLSLNETPLATITAQAGEWENVFRIELKGSKVTNFAPFKGVTAPKLRRFEGPVLEGATEATCPTEGVPGAIASYCQGQIGGFL